MPIDGIFFQCYNKLVVDIVVLINIVYTVIISTYSLVSMLLKQEVVILEEFKLDVYSRGKTMDNKQTDPYFDPFPTSLRKLMEKNPSTGKPVSPNELAAVLGTSAQTISYYINGKRKPVFDNIVTLCMFFDVSADFLLFGIDTKNIDMHKDTGLSNEAIEMLVNAHNTNNESNDIYEILNSILSDRDFYEFIEDVDFHAARLKELQSLDITELEKRYPGINMVGYSKWTLMKDIEFFVYSQLKKRGYLEDLEL